jgi:hypothetical protein
MNDKFKINFDATKDEVSKIFTYVEYCVDEEYNNTPLEIKNVSCVYVAVALLRVIHAREDESVVCYSAKDEFFFMVFNVKFGGSTIASVTFSTEESEEVRKRAVVKADGNDLYIPPTRDTERRVSNFGQNAAALTHHVVTYLLSEDDYYEDYEDGFQDLYAEMRPAIIFGLEKITGR